MKRAKIIIRSKQLLEEQEEVQEIIYEGQIERNENTITLYYDNTILKIVENGFELQNEVMHLGMERQKKCVTEYKTPYGILPMTVEGKEVIVTQNPLVIFLQYEIQLGNTKAYTNEMQIEVREE